MQQDSPASTFLTKTSPVIDAEVNAVNIQQSSTVICPRCGYDLRGVMATWSEQGACPLTGTCAECGLVFDWIDVINPSRIKPMWCVEYARGRVGWVKSVAKTFALQCVPWKFWRQLRMHHEPRFRRIAAYLVLLLLTVYPALAAGQGRAAWEEYHGRPLMLIQPAPGMQMPAPPPPPPNAISDWHAVGWSILLPFSSTSPGLHAHPYMGVWPFPSPLELLKESWDINYFSYGQYVRLRHFGLLANFWVMLLLFMPLTFALLPQTRRTAKVRWAHIIRIGLYGAAFTVPLLWWVALWQVPESGMVAYLLLGSINLVWWGWACSIYLQLPRPWFVASLLTFMLMLAAAAFQHYSFGTAFITTIMSV